MTLKTIRYQDGLVTFRLPADWTEAREHDGGGLYIGPEDDAGALRLRVFTFETPEAVSAELVAETLRSMQEDGERPIDERPSGNAIRRHTEQTGDSRDDGARRMICWEVASPVPPDRMHLAVFSYTISGRQAADLGVRRQIELLDREIRATVFAPGAGAPSGKSTQRRRR